MTLSPSFRSQLEARLASIHRKFPDERVIGIRTANRWSGDEGVRIDGTSFRLVQCDAPLQVREALLEVGEGEGWVVIITALEDRELGEDVLARLFKRRLHRIQPWPILLDLFQARSAVPQLLGKRWLAEALLRDAPTQGYPPTPSGVLDEESVWRILLCDRLRLPTHRPDLRNLLDWSMDATGVEMYRQSPELLREGLREWVAESAGQASEYLFACIESGQAADAVPVGLVCRVVFGEGGSAELTEAPELKEAAVRLERFIGNRPFDRRLALQWAEAAERLIRQLSEQGERSVQQRVDELLDRADQILTGIRVERLTWLSDCSPAGFEQRFARFGERLAKELQGGRQYAADDLRGRAEEIRRHKRAALAPERVERVRMAQRLLKWISLAEESEPADFVESARRYLREGGYVDWARRAVAQGDGNPMLSSAYEKLFQRALAKREVENQRFGALLTNWTEAESSGGGVLLIEDVLRRIVAPIANHVPVLMIVVDGMSCAVFHELMAEIGRSGWQMMAPGEGEWPQPVIAALPSVTEVSRASLLCGRLTSGVSADEVKGFAGNAELLSISRAKLPPVLFHKGNLTTGGGAVLAEKVRTEIENDKRRVVGAVVNAVDDHLAKGEQLLVPWRLSHLPVLQHLLDAARDARRVVVVTSDHGHIIERETAYRKSETGERHREDDGKPLEDEVRISGSRVVRPGGRMIAPWGEAVRYSRKKHGYHGGVSPQECVVPLAVLARPMTKLGGWEVGEEPTPDWWAVDKPRYADGAEVAEAVDGSPASAEVDSEPTERMPLFSHLAVKTD